MFPNFKKFSLLTNEPTMTTDNTMTPLPPPQSVPHRKCAKCSQPESQHSELGLKCPVYDNITGAFKGYHWDKSFVFTPLSSPSVEQETQDEPRPNWYCESCGAENISSVSYCQVCKDGPYKIPSNGSVKKRVAIITPVEQDTELQKTFAEVMQMTHTEITDLIVELRTELEQLRKENEPHTAISDYKERLKKEIRQRMIHINDLIALTTSASKANDLERLRSELDRVLSLIDRTE